MDHDRWIETVTAELTGPEKVSLLSGADRWSTAAVERLSVPAVKMTDGPNGARGDGTTGATAASFPVGTALGASWDVELAEEVGAALGAEARTKGAHVLLGPTVNLHRSPLAGRNFEALSEDPLLTGRLAAAYVRGVQGQGVGACLKHFVANESEFERMTMSSEVDERTLRELYLLPFEHAVAEAQPWAVMGAYNRVNGVYACAHKRLLTEVLKGEWAFDGVVVSDWHALHDTVGPAEGGCDLEMPGPARWFGARLQAALDEGVVGDAVVDEKVRRVLRLVARTGGPGREPPGPERAEDRAEVRALARRAAVAGMVLLKNRAVGSRPVLPLDLGSLRRLAVVGPNAGVGAHQGGGSSMVRPHYLVHPLEGLVHRLGDAVEVVHTPGAAKDRYVPEPDPSWFVPLDDDGRGVHVAYFDGEEPTGAPVADRFVRGVSHAWWTGPPVPDPRRWSARWMARFVPPVDGSWRVAVAGTGRTRVRVDGDVVADNWTAPRPGPLFFARGTAEVVGEVELRVGELHELVVELSPFLDDEVASIRLGMAPPPDPDRLAKAVELAAGADAVVAVVGTDPEWETEGSDRPFLHLPGDQDELVRQVAAANPRTVVVLNSGAPVELPWEPEVPALVQLWFAGQEQGHALAAVLTGDAEPGGRLPTTFPLRYEDHPALFNYPGEGGVVRYGERVFVGYRGYEARRQPVRFPFGHGLSYTTFAHRNLTVAPVRTGPATGDATADSVPGNREVADGRFPGVAVEVEVVNTGERPGHEVTQVFVAPPPGRLQRPPRELEAFAKSALAPGESRRLRFVLDLRAFAAFDPVLPGWRVEAGDHRIEVCSGGQAELAAVWRVDRPVEVPLARPVAAPPHP